MRFFKLSLLLLTLVSCSDSKNLEIDDNDNRQDQCTLTFRGLSFSGSSSSTENIGEVAVFQFTDGLLYRHNAITPADNGKAEISIVGDTRLYCISGAGLQADDNVTEEADFSKSIIESPDGAASAPVFLSAVTEVKAAGNTNLQTRAQQATLEMKRGVARIDLDSHFDSKVLINEITVENAPAATYAFIDNEDATDHTISYSKTYSEPFNGIDEGVFHVFGSRKPVNITVRGSYDGVPVRLNVEIPAVERNRIYIVEILNAGATLEGIFSVKDWEEGGSVTGKPDTSRKIAISAENSVLPEGVSLDTERNLVSVPASGVTDMRLAFVADTAIDITSTEGLPEGGSLGDRVVSESSQGIVSAFSVTIPAQRNGRLGYSIFVHLKNALLAGSYDYVEIAVAPSDHQIETVEIGGSVWMAFNSRTPDLDDQIYPLDGISVEDMYRLNWINTVGGLYQFGRQYMYVPWQGYNPSNDLGSQKQDIPWQSPTHMPCPEGFRIPTRAEFESMFPKGTTIPGEYVAGNGEHITATLHTSEGPLITPSGVTGTQRYVKFTSAETGRYLIIPLAGGKGDKSTSNNPGFGRRAVIWTNSNQGCPGGYALAYWMKFEANDTTVITEERLQMEGFASVRCVKTQQPSEGE